MGSYIFIFSILFNWISIFFPYFSISHVIQWEFFIFFIFSSIFHVIQWRLHIFSILFNFPCYSIETFAFCHVFINFPCNSMEIIEIFIFCQFLMIFNGAIVLPNPIKQNSPCVLPGIVPFGAAARLNITYNQQPTKQGNGYR